MEPGDKFDILIDRLLISHQDAVNAHEDNKRIIGIGERQARATEGIESHLNTNVPAILTALGIVQAKQKSDDDTAAIKLWDRFTKAPVRVQWLISGLILAAIASGWAHRLYEMLAGK